MAHLGIWCRPFSNAIENIITPWTSDDRQCCHGEVFVESSLGHF